jgi:peptidoglycan/LPS O-acetylase OafA/YrhL
MLRAAFFGREDRAPLTRLATGHFRPDVEGLRAVAVGLVVLDHAGVTQMSGGFVGVDVFFVLSGFLITTLLLKERENSGRTSLAGFYARRVRRILPAGTLVLIVTVVAAYVWLGVSRADRVADDARWSALFASNVRFIQQGTDYFAAGLATSPLQHFWSLAVEEQFYFVWPAIIILVGFVSVGVAFRRILGLVLVIVITASLGWSVYETGVNGTVAYFSPLPRAWELATGAFVAVATPRLLGFPRPVGVAASIAGLVAILAAALLFNENTPFPGYAVALPVVGSAAAIAGGTIAPGAGAEWLLGQPLFQWLGRRSYSFYLWHWPILVIVPVIIGRILSLGESLLACGFALILAAVTFAAVEAPIRNSRRLKSAPPFHSVALGGALVMVAVAVGTGLLTVYGAPPAPIAPPQVVLPPN